MTTYELFLSIGEPFAAGLFEWEGEAPIVRYANALRRFFEYAKLPPYEGGMLYPQGMCPFTYDKSVAVKPHYGNTMTIDYPLLEQKSKVAFTLMKAEDDLVVKFNDSPHTVGGMGWTHAFPNYGRVFNEGLNGYAVRVGALPEGDFCRGMQILLEGIGIYHRRCLVLLTEANAPKKLTDALSRMPYEPPKSIYEALLSLNFIFYIDGCDNVGPLDRLLLPYHRGEDMVPLLREFFGNVDINYAWSGTLGPNYNDLTRMCLRAVHHLRRPSFQLLVTPDMPDWVWEESAAALATGCGQPAMYNLPLYEKTIRELIPEVNEADLGRIAFAGCTETMFEGLSAVGSDDAGINHALILSDYMREGLAACTSYDDFYRGLVAEMRRAVAATLDRLNEYRRTRALYRPSVVRTLLVDDCLENQTEFNAGGARYVYSLINNAGVINVIDSLNAIRELVYDKKKYAPKDFIALMDARDPAFLADAEDCPFYGNDNDAADAVGTALIADIAEAFSQRECYPRGRFYPVANQFKTFIHAGGRIPATPDGRAYGAPLCDSLGAIHGNDYKGPTALLNSVAKLGLHQFIGSPVTNMRISKKHLPTVLAPLVSVFFENGGMQLQITCASREEMLDAMVHPEAHKSLIVRVGGFSEYFIRLDPAMQKSIIERTEF